MRVLVLGSGGQVGIELLRAPWESDTQVQGLTHAELDVTDGARVRDSIARRQCDVVVNAAAYTAVDKAEVETHAAFAVNRDGAGNVAEACARTGAKLVHISTDYVFDGTKTGAYREDDPIAPINAYGASKAAGEDRVRAALARHLILRSSWIFGASGSNFVKAMLRVAAKPGEIRVVNDQIGSPTAAGDLAAAIARLVPQIDGKDDCSGTYHYCGRDELTWHDFARRIFSLTPGVGPGAIERLRAIPTSAYASAARRPANSRLDCSRFTSTFGIERPPLEPSLRRVLNQLQLENAS